MILSKIIILVLAIHFITLIISQYLGNFDGDDNESYKINSMDHESSSKFLADSHQRNFASYFTVINLDFMGSWYANTFDKPLNYFSNMRGKVYFNLEEDPLNVFNFVLYDGDYRDKKTANLVIYFNNNTDYKGNSSWKNDNNTQFTITTGDELSTDFMINCTGSYSLIFIDTNTQQPASNYTNIVHPAQMNMTFTININDQMDQKCSLFVNGTASANDFALQSDTMKFSMLITLICVINLYSSIQLIKFILEYESEGQKQFFHYFITPAFWYFILSTIFETRLISILWKIRYQHQFATNTDLSSGIVSFYLNFYGIMAIFLIISYSFIPRTWFFYLTGFYFLPQIIHNVLRGQRYRLNWNYLIGLGTLRITFPLYMKACPNNIFELTPDPNFLWCYSTIIIFQLLMLILQTLFGSRFFIPSFLLPPKFNYFHKFPAMAEEIQNDACPICMDCLAKEPKDINSELLKTPNEVNLMITPCHHKFHEKCLKEWLKIKLECPSCRQSMPSLDYLLTQAHTSPFQHKKLKNKLGIFDAAQIRQKQTGIGQSANLMRIEKSYDI